MPRDLGSANEPENRVGVLLSLPNRLIKGNDRKQRRKECFPLPSSIHIERCRQTEGCCASLHRSTPGGAKLEQSEMVGILGLQRAHQNLKPL